jgi:hypothetical protein
VKPQINLYNPQLRSAREIFSFRVLLIGIAASLALGVLGYAWYGYQVAGNTRQARELDARLQAMRDETLALSKAVSVRSRNSELESRQQQLETRLVRLEAVGKALEQADGDVAAGFSEFMRAFARQTMPGVWLTGFSFGAGGTEMRIDGRAQNPDLVPGYIARLNSESVLQGRSFARFAVRQSTDATPAAVSAAAAKTPQQTASAYHEFRLVSSLAEGASGKGDTP